MTDEQITKHADGVASVCTADPDDFSEHHGAGGAGEPLDSTLGVMIALVFVVGMVLGFGVGVAV